jgi:hypothetical protein
MSAVFVSVSYDAKCFSTECMPPYIPGRPRKDDAVASVVPAAPAPLVVAAIAADGGTLPLSWFAPLPGSIQENVLLHCRQCVVPSASESWGRFFERFLGPSPAPHASVTVESNELSVSTRRFPGRLAALACVSAAAAQACVNSVLAHCRRLESAGHLKLHGSVQFSSYDETPCDLRTEELAGSSGKPSVLKFNRRPRNCKVFQGCGNLVIVLELRGTGEIVTLELAAGTHISVMDFATAEATGACVDRLWEGIDLSGFDYRFSANSHDRAASNLKFEDVGSDMFIRVRLHHRAMTSYHSSAGSCGVGAFDIFVWGLGGI